MNDSGDYVVLSVGILLVGLCLNIMGRHLARTCADACAECCFGPEEEKKSIGLAQNNPTTPPVCCCQ